MPRGGRACGRGRNCRARTSGAGAASVSRFAPRSAPGSTGASALPAPPRDPGAAWRRRRRARAAHSRRVCQPAVEPLLLPRVAPRADQGGEAVEQAMAVAMSGWSARSWAMAVSCEARAFLRAGQQQPDRLGRGEAVARRGHRLPGGLRDAELPDRPHDRTVGAGVALRRDLAPERPRVATALVPALRAGRPRMARGCWWCDWRGGAPGRRRAPGTSGRCGGGRRARGRWPTCSARARRRRGSPRSSRPSGRVSAPARRRDPAAGGSATGAIRQTDAADEGRVAQQHAPDHVAEVAQ